MSSSLRLNTGVFTLLAIIAVGVFHCASAFAVGAPYRFDGVATEQLNKEAPGGAFVQPFGLAFDSGGDLFVSDPEGNLGEGAVDKFNGQDAFQAPQFGPLALSGQYTRGVAVNDETGHIYVGDLLNGVVVMSSSGEKLSQWTGANTPAKSFGEGCCFVYTAVDNAPSSPSKGDVYVATSQEGGKVYVFKVKGEDKEEGELVRELKAPDGFSFSEDAGIAVDQSTGQVYVADSRHLVVDRFSATGEYEASAQIKGVSPSEPFAEPVAVGVDGATGEVFVVDKRKSNVVGGAEAVDEFSSSGEFITQIKETGENEPLQHPVAVAVQPTGPRAGEVYVSDTVAKAVDVFAPVSPEAPVVEGTGVRQLSDVGVSLLAEVDPRGASTEYRIEYGRCASASSCSFSPYEQRVPEPDALLGFEDFKTHATPSFPVRGLIPGTAYHVRVIAHNAVGETAGGERVFTTLGGGGALSLPDERAWELVSPPDKHGGTVGGGGESGLVESSVDGSAISYLANAPTEAGPEGNSGSVQVLSRRGAGGWSSRDIASPHQSATGNAPGAAPEYRFFAEDLSEALVQPFGLFNPALSAEASEQTPYERTLGSCTSGCYRPLVTGKAGFANVAEGTRFGEEQLCEREEGAVPSICGPEFLDASPDGGHAVLRSAAPLVAGAPRNELYEWAGGRLQLVSVLSRNEAGEELPAPTGPFLEEQPLLGTAFGLPFGPSARHAISGEGSRVFFESGTNLYMRDTTKGETLEVDLPEAGCGEGECTGGAGRFELASSDGSRVFFTDKNRLSKDAGAQVGSPDLYECKIFTDEEGRLACHLTDRTPIEGEAGADVQGALLGAGEDGGTVYFVANGALAGTGASRGSCEGNGEEQPEISHCNLYELREGEAKLVAVLSGADARDWTRATEFQPTRVSPDGRFLSFMSERPLSGYDNRDALSAKRDAEIYEYDSFSESLSCASCDPSGARPRGVEYKQLASGASRALPAVGREWEAKGWVAALPPRTESNGQNQPVYQPRYLSGSGRLFFDSLDALVPQDVNDTGDVYEYEPSGVGSCGEDSTLSATGSLFEPSSDGCIALISSGVSAEASAFLDASTTGDDVFFRTASKLSGQDIDSAQDIYDAHVCSSESPCTNQTVPPPPCNTEASCKAAPTPPPAVFGTPPSATFNGLGNATPATVVQAKAKPPTRAQKLTKALAVCHRDKKKAKRAQCERLARGKFGPVKRAKGKGSK